MNLNYLKYIQVILFIVLVTSIYANLYFYITQIQKPNSPINNKQLNEQNEQLISMTSNTDEHDELKKNSHLIQEANLALIKVSKHLATAHRYARSGITMQEINTAYSLIQHIFFHLQSQSNLAFHSNLNNASDKQHQLDECPEIYVQDKKEFQVLPCNKKALNQIISFLFIFPDCKSGAVVLNGIPQHYNNVSIRIGVEKREKSCDSLFQSTRTALKDFQFIDAEVSNNAEGWKTLLKRANTKYVLIGRDLDSFNNQSSIERLIRVLSVTGIEAIGGSDRYEDGRWSTGCYQMSMKNYTLRLVQGYDQSYNSCLYCDYLSTAFVSRRDNLIVKLSSDVSGSVLFMDYFMQLFRADKIGAMSCPDVMFSTLPSNQVNEISRDNWQSIAIKWKLNRIVLPNDKDIWFTCGEARIICIDLTKRPKGEVVPPCCLEILRNEILRMMKIFKEYGVYMELTHGTLIGAVKFSSTIPWDVDSDFIYSVDKPKELSALLEKHFRHKGYSILRVSDKRYPGGRYKITFTHWFAEWYGLHRNDAGGNLYSNSTKVLFDGVWVNSPPNPVLYLRKVYGDDLFQHIEHWRPIFNNKFFSNWTQIKRGHFMPCKVYFHGCLSNFLPAGNLQFRNIWF